MNELNYHHLLYFWTVVREGSVTAACKRLHLAQPTVSAQIKSLERAMGQPLFARSGRRLVLTDFGRMVHGYAERIFAGDLEVDPSRKAVKLGDRPVRLTPKQFALLERAAERQHGGRTSSVSASVPVGRLSP